MNPLVQAGLNQSGITYVVSKMDWYWSLSGLLLDNDRAPEGSVGLRKLLEQRIVALYVALLAYQIQSIIYYDRRRGGVFVRDMFKLDDWEGELKTIKEMENAIERDISQSTAFECQGHLQKIAELAERQNSNLQRVVSAIQIQSEHPIQAKKDAEDKQCLRDLYLTRPRDDKARVEKAKGGLLTESYRWIFENAAYQKWFEDPGSRLLWIEGYDLCMTDCNFRADGLVKPTWPGQDHAYVWHH